MQSLFLKNGENVSTYYIDEDANEVNYAIQLCRDRNPKGIVFLGGNLEYFKEDFAHIHIPCLLLTNNSSDLDFDNLSSLKYSKLPPKKTIPFGLRSRQSWIA